MGAWGYGCLENDTALDFIGYLENYKGKEPSLRKIMREMEYDAEYVDSDVDSEILALAAVILNQEKIIEFTEITDEVPYLPYNKDDIKVLIEQIGDILGNSESHELYELWEEAEEENFNEWKQEVEDLGEALSDLLK
jgi:hypothetical protein